MLTGEGLDLAVSGADAIVRRASSSFHKARQVDVEGIERLLEAAARAGVSHVVYISTLGLDLVPSYLYYRIKLGTERVIEGSPVPYTILRATQFYDLVLTAIRYLDRLPVMVMPKGFLGQHIDVGEVADRLVELALSEPAGRVQDVGGPEVRTLDRPRTWLLRGRETSAKDLRDPAARQDDARVSRGCADASGWGLRKDPLGGVLERDTRSCHTEYVRRLMSRRWRLDEK